DLVSQVAIRNVSYRSLSEIPRAIFGVTSQNIAEFDVVKGKNTEEVLKDRTTRRGLMRVAMAFLLIIFAVFLWRLCIYHTRDRRVKPLLQEMPEGEIKF